MSADQDDPLAGNNTPNAADKGKGRATERTPLLNDGGRSYSESGQHRADEQEVNVPRRRIGPRIIRVFLISLAVTIALVIALVALAWSYASQAARLSTDDIIDTAVAFDGPYSAHIINTTDSGGIWVKVSGRVGLDAGAILGVHPEENDGLLNGVWKSVGRWGVHRLGVVSAEAKDVYIHNAHNRSERLASLTLPPLNLQLSADPPSDSSWLYEMSLEVLVTPTQNTTTLVSFLRQSWEHGDIQVSLAIPKIHAFGGQWGRRTWRHTVLDRTMHDVKSDISIHIPPLPGLPPPGPGEPFPPISELVTLKSFKIYPFANRLSVTAKATVVDPAPESFQVSTPRMPFIVSIPYLNSTVPIASVSTAPFSLTHPNISLDISGEVLPLPSSASPLLSQVVAKYLTGKSNSLSITSPWAPGIDVRAEFPGPQPPPQLLRNVTIKDMKLNAVGTTFVASGDIHARLVLPKGLDLDLSVARIWPDVLIFDAEGESETVNFRPEQPPIPVPVPDKAFARIRPDDWVEADSQPSPSDKDEGSSYYISARIVEVPLEVLPGRAQEFSNFVSKVLFGSNGALAGLVGATAAGVDVINLPLEDPYAEGKLVLEGIPFHGNVRIRKNGLHSPLEKLRRMLHLHEL